MDGEAIADGYSAERAAERDQHFLAAQGMYAWWRGGAATEADTSTHEATVTVAILLNQSA